MIVGLIEMEISVLTSILILIPWKRLKNSPPQSGIPIYNSEVSDTADRKTIRRTQAIASVTHFMQTQKNGDCNFQRRSIRGDLR